LSPPIIKGPAGQGHEGQEGREGEEGKVVCAVFAVSEGLIVVLGINEVMGNQG
jgi:hypothetical protein